MELAKLEMKIEAVRNEVNWPEKNLMQDHYVYDFSDEQREIAIKLAKSLPDDKQVAIAFYPKGHENKYDKTQLFFATARTIRKYDARLELYNYLKLQESLKTLFQDEPKPRKTMKI